MVDEEVTTEHRAHFKMSGVWLADFCIQRMKEGHWDHSMRILESAGMEPTDAVKLLKGEITLVGDTENKKGIRIRKLKPDDPKRRDVENYNDSMYGRMFRLNGKVYRPYAVVAGYDREDWDWARKWSNPPHLYNVEETGRKLAGALRSLAYAKNPYSDLLVRLPERLFKWGDSSLIIADTLSELVQDNVPYWYTISNNEPVRFLEDYLDKRGLEVRGAIRKYSLPGPKPMPDPEIDRYADRDVDEEDRAIKLDQIESKTYDQGSLGEPEPGTTSVDVEIEKLDRKNEAKKLAEEALVVVETYLSSPATDYAELCTLENTLERVVDNVSKHFTDSQWDRLTVVRTKCRQERERILGDQVRAQAEIKGGFFDLPLEDGTKLRRVPKFPFMLWVMRANFNFKDFGIELQWDYVSPVGYKMQMDDPAHTDWLLGAYVDLGGDKLSVSDPIANRYEMVMRSAWSYKDIMVREYTGRQFTFLARENDRVYAWGEVVHPGPGCPVPKGSIAVVPNAGPDYQLAMELSNKEDDEHHRGLIICETGGKLAHLATVGREFGCTVLMVPDALKLYPVGRKLSIDLVDGVITPRSM